MSLGPVILDFSSLELTAEEKEILRHPQVGGVILFTRNFHSIEQLKNLIQAIRQASSKRLLITVDHEGGRVQRFRKGFTELPPLANIGAIYTQNAVLGTQLARQHAWLVATELLAFDIDLSFTPVLDLNKNISQVIGTRAFHDDPRIVAELGKIYIESLQQAGMACVGKHFPGHGSVALDSHTDIPLDERTFAAIASDDLIPFAKLANYLTGIMPAHVIYREVDSLPAGFSKFWLQEILRNQLKYAGAIFSDDLGMAGAHMMGSIVERTHAALQAGCDSVLICNDQNSAIAVLEQLERVGYKSSQLSDLRLKKLLATQKYNRQELIKSAAWQQAAEALKQIS